MADEDMNEVLGAKQREQQRIASRPHIDHLRDALDDTNNLVVGKGEKIVIERFMTWNGAWLDTKTYVITDVRQDGTLCLKDDMGKSVLTNVEIGLQHKFRFKLPDDGKKLKKAGKPAPLDGMRSRKAYQMKGGGVMVFVSGMTFVTPGPTFVRVGEYVSVTVAGDVATVVTQDGVRETWKKRP